MIITLLVHLALQCDPIEYNGDDYQRPDVVQRRLERQEDQRWHSEKWERQQEDRQRWLDGIQRRD